MSDDLHLIYDDMRRHPNGELRVYSEQGRLISGTWPYQALRDVDRLLAAVSRVREQLVDNSPTVGTSSDYMSGWDMAMTYIERALDGPDDV